MLRDPFRNSRKRSLDFFFIIKRLGIYLFVQVDRLEDELVAEQDKYKSITEELEQTFAEMSGY